jgi:DGQHR domain-containing protein
MKIKVQPFKQEGTQLYSGVMRAEDLVRIGQVDVYRMEGGSHEGYQRMPEPSRTRLVAQYLKNDSKPLLPTSVLLSYRGKLELDGEYLEIPDGEKVYIVDGQHRVYGIQRAIEELGLERLRDYEVPVAIIENPKTEEEANQFRVINETMKKVRTDLARRLLALKYSKAGTQGRREIRLAGRVWEASAAEIIEVLSRDKDGPWVGRIQPPNSKKVGSHVIRELSFSTSLKPIVSRRPYSEWQPGRVADRLKLFWSTVEELVPEAFDKPEEYVLQKTPGVFSMHVLAFAVFEELRVNGIGDPSVDDFKNILEDLGEYVTAEYWKNDNPEGAAMAGSMKGFNLIAEDMIEQLQRVGKLTG